MKSFLISADASLAAGEGWLVVVKKKKTTKKKREKPVMKSHRY